MATFSIVVAGETSKPVLAVPIENTNSCESSFLMRLSANIGDSIKLSWDLVPLGYVTYSVTLTVDSLPIAISTDHTFIFSTITSVTVIMQNTGVSDEALSIDLLAENLTTTESTNRVLTRTSTGAIC